MRHSSRVLTAAVFTSTALLFGCGGGKDQPPGNNPMAVGVSQDEPCMVDVFFKKDVASKCKKGQKVVYLPDRWGNEQLPILFSGINCDLRYGIVSNNGGVTCIFVGLSPAEDAALSAAAASAAAASSAASNPAIPASSP